MSNANVETKITSHHIMIDRRSSIRIQNATTQIDYRWLLLFLVLGYQYYDHISICKPNYYWYIPLLIVQYCTINFNCFVVVKGSKLLLATLLLE